MTDAVIKNGKLVIELTAKQLEEATIHSPSLEIPDEDGNGYRKVTVTDNALWMKAICNELNREEEDGTTLIHLMFDKAFERASENGEEGMEIEGFD